MMDAQNQDDYPIEEQEDGSAVVDLPEMDMEEQADGSAIINMDDGPEFNPEFYDNLADSIDPSELSTLASSRRITWVRFASARNRSGTPGRSSR